MPRVTLATELHKGFSLMEIVIAISMFLIIVTAFTGAIIYGQTAVRLSGDRNRALLVAEEGIEAVRNIRDNAFLNLVDGNYGLTRSGNVWSFSGTSDTDGKYTRQVAISSVDAKTKQITSTVDWQQNSKRTGTEVLTCLMTYWQEMVGGDCSNLIEAFSLDLSGSASGTKVQTQGSYAYVIRASGVDFSIVDVSSPTSPVVISSLSLPGTLSNIFVAGNYAYVTSSDNSAEMIIVDISNPSSPSVIGTYNDAGGDNANGVYVVGNYAFIVFSGGDELVVVDVSLPNSPTIMDGLSLSGNGREVYVSGNYAYIASESNSQELIVVDVSNPSSLGVYGSLDLSGNGNANSVAGTGPNVYIARASGDFNIIDISNPAVPVLLGSYSDGQTMNDISLNNPDSCVFIAENQTTNEFIVIDISEVTAPILKETVNFSGNSLSGVAYSSDLHAVFVVGQGNPEEFAVILSQ